MVPRITMSLVHDDDKEVIRTNGGEECSRGQYRFNGSLQTVSKGKLNKTSNRDILNKEKLNDYFQKKNCENFLVLIQTYNQGYEAACEEGPGVFAHVLTFFSIILIIITLPVSLLWVVKVVQVRSNQYFSTHICI